MNHVEIHCDGACSHNPGPGGWASILVWRDKKKELSGFEKSTTNNRMEMTAAIKGLEAVRRNMPIKVYTDSLYLQKGITVWLENWKKKGLNNCAIKNIDLWQRLDQLNQSLMVEWYWVKGHNGDYYNELADSLARAAIKDMANH
ncbi:ribonuclease HI [Rickettsiales endosymbiont of Peranema trichophorum]|uniref:ribonuclease HI n=1 Tax=Rickettsiales endosymbiont of Peranema trichophorum TaxID=2486577 RepID=UPI0010231639|nr:ribonuclease HI [Rickettsiales endosymbiont of Peranema trichophorum]RZI46313.1 ribonuclease HI [Rickettsiales endosymbiont of Peranema trichophorum]